MDDEWDLHAVVRSCTTASANSAAGVDDDDPCSSFRFLSFQNDDNSFLYPAFMESPSYKSEGLEEIYRESYSQPPMITTAPQITAAPSAATSFISVHGGGAYDMLKDSHTFSIQDMNSQSIRYRKRKKQQKKMVRQMTQEELSNDSWAWRKYGQKPIKGSPYPRNYFRCSTSKGCEARKQVERSPMDSTIFIVSYTGEHDHPRPTHRNSLAGSTRSKISTENKMPISGNNSSGTVPNNPPTCSLSSPASASGFFPPTSVMEEESDDDDILIPSITMTEEILKGFQELNTGREGFFSLPPPRPWSPTSSGAGDC